MERTLVPNVLSVVWTDVFFAIRALFRERSVVVSFELVDLFIGCEIQAKEQLLKGEKKKKRTAEAHVGDGGEKQRDASFTCLPPNYHGAHSELFDFMTSSEPIQLKR